tara:strand:+ start:1281 stop:2396 length:1116 start_codon:yes stop_codon:yes gene_type:complete
MKTKPLTFLLALTFLFLFSGSVYGDDSQLNKLKESNKTGLMPLDCKFPKAYLFGKRIQQAVKDKDLTSIFNMVEGELAFGPRKKDALEKSFDEVFTDEWREKILSTEPMCGPQGVYGFHLGNGNLWYDTDDIDDLPYTGSNWNIFSIHGTILKDSSKPDKPSWTIAKKLLMTECFEVIWASSDNYEDYHERYGGNSKFRDFYQNIGEYIGTKIPLDRMHGGVDYPLAKDLKLCTTPYAGNEKTISLNNNSEKRTIEIGEERVREKYCSLDGDCEAGYYYDDSYSVLRNLPKEACGLLAPQLKSNCIDVRLVRRPPQFRGGFPSGVIYGIIKESTKNKLYVVPLKNIGTVNDALNFADTLISKITRSDKTRR